MVGWRRIGEVCRSGRRGPLGLYTAEWGALAIRVAGKGQCGDAAADGNTPVVENRSAASSPGIALLAIGTAILTRPREFALLVPI